MIRRMSMSTGRGAEPAIGLALLAPAITHFFRMWTETISGRMSFSPAWKPGRSRPAMVLLRSGTSVGTVAPIAGGGGRSLRPRAGTIRLPGDKEYPRLRCESIPGCRCARPLRLARARATLHLAHRAWAGPGAPRTALPGSGEHRDAPGPRRGHTRTGTLSARSRGMQFERNYLITDRGHETLTRHQLGLTPCAELTREVIASPSR